MSIKGRYWSVIGWLESLPDNIFEDLKKSGLQVVVSPLHNKDVDENGESQKDHYHILLAWDGPTTLNSVQDFCENLGLSRYVESVRSVKNILDYMTHDSYSSKEKARYDIKDIQWINCNIYDFVKIGYRAVIEFIKVNKITQFSKLVNALLDKQEYDILEFVANHTYYVNTYICSLKIDVDKDIKQAYDLLKGIADEVDARGKFTLNKKDYCRLMDVFEQLDVFTYDI